MTRPNDGGERLDAVMNALAEHAAAASDEDLLNSAAAEGLDVKAEGSQVRDLLLGAVALGKKERLRQAGAAYQQAVVAFGASATRLPNDAAERRALLKRSFKKRPDMNEMLTVQYRDFDSMAEADVESALKQLAALGLLDEGDPP